MRTWYRILYVIVKIFFTIVHPQKTVGREHIPAGGAIVCGNHTGMSDPIMVIFGFHLKNQIRPMAKVELSKVPVVGWALRKIGCIFVDREKNDVAAVKQAIKYLRSGEKILLFPEGTRVHEGEEAEGKNGAALLAVRCGVPLVPVYIPPQKKRFRRTTIVIGQPYTPTVAGRKGTPEEYDAITADLMSRIQALKDQAV